ncbi:MAG: precorrin-8X methylmutase [Thermodesulfobacteriota bacterium]
MRPEEIERTSFSIIDEEAGRHGFDPEHWAVVRRMIHTTADFDYLRTVRFHRRALSEGVRAIRRGCAIVTDTNMARSGIRKAPVERFGCRVLCLMEDPAVAAQAREQGVTRARAAVDAACGIMESGIYVVGNAPTALLRLLENIREAKALPALVVGLPVGFVNAAESKAALLEADIPFITNHGRKGGSNVAAAVVNALAILAEERILS